jgi:DNA-binding NarL/FixJ family response regulator
MIRLFVIEDHLTLVLASLKYMFRPQRDGITVTGSAETPEVAISCADREGFDIFILDLLLPGLRPVDNIRALRKHFPTKPIMIYSSEKSSYWINTMMDEGAAAFVSKDATRDEISFAIKKAASGEYVFSGKMGARNENVDLSNKSGIGQPILEPVETEIAKLLTKGPKHKEISDQLGISRSKAEKILKQMQKKFHAANNLDLIKILSEKGLI